jgi:hypothetical protein
MAYSVSGQLVDKDGQPIGFALVYTSDSNGKPLSGSKNTTTDDKGRWVLTGVDDSDYITGSSVGYAKKTVSANSIIPINFGGNLIRTTKITLPDDVKATLDEVPIKAKKITIKPNNVGKYVMIGSAGLLLVTGIMFIVAKSKKLI